MEVRILLPESADELTPGQLLLVVTPRSERGGRWFDSSPRIWMLLGHRESSDGSQPAGSGACLENRWRREPLVGSSPTASAWKTGEPRLHVGASAQVRQPAERPGLNPGACGFDSHPGH